MGTGEFLGKPNKSRGSGLRWTSILSRGSRNTPNCFMLPKLGWAPAPLSQSAPRLHTHTHTIYMIFFSVSIHTTTSPKLLWISCKVFLKRKRDCRNLCRCAHLHWSSFDCWKLHVQAIQEKTNNTLWRLWLFQTQDAGGRLLLWCWGRQWKHRIGAAVIAVLQYNLFYKSIFYKNIEAESEICKIFRILS